jgi:ribonuclease Z
MDSTRLKIIGTDTVVPHAANDTACLLLNSDCLVDAGWNAAIAMRAFGCDPMAVDTLFITHCHHDHYLGLPHLLFYHAMRRSERPDKPPLTIVGPKPDIGMVVERALSFLRHDQFPEVAALPHVVALQAGDTFETARLSVTTAPTVHPVVGLCYRFADLQTGAVVVVSGDTAFHRPLATHASAADVLVHEASRGPGESLPNARGGHSGAVDAARIALEAGVKRLVLVHYPQSARDAVLAAAQAIFPASHAALPGQEFILP